MLSENEKKTFKCNVKGGNPTPSKIKWTIDGNDLQDFNPIGTNEIEVVVKKDWSRKVLKCSVMQVDSKVRSLLLFCILSFHLGNHIMIF